MRRREGAGGGGGGREGGRDGGGCQQCTANFTLSSPVSAGICRLSNACRAAKPSRGCMEVAEERRDGRRSQEEVSPAVCQR